MKRMILSLMVTFVLPIVASIVFANNTSVGNDDGNYDEIGSLVLQEDLGESTFKNPCKKCPPPAPVPRTGQTISCLTGDDGDLQKGIAWPNPRFTDNLDGTVTDNLTELIWLKDANCFGQGSWTNALAESNELAEPECGLSDGSNAGDWRLPNRFELESLLNLGEYFPALSSGHPFINVSNNARYYYWSSTTDPALSLTAWNVNITHGFLDYDPKTRSYGIWPVRGGQTFKNNYGRSKHENHCKKCPPPAPVHETGQTACYDESGAIISCMGTGQDGEYQNGVASPNPRFTDTNDGTVTDNLTGLVWLQDANCMATYYQHIYNDYPDVGRVTWQHAHDFVAGINNGTFPSCSAGYTDWRLPNRFELESLLDLSGYGYYEDYRALPSGHSFINVEIGYWSSTSTECSNNAWNINLYSNGYLSNNTAGPRHVWPVRGGK